MGGNVIVALCVYKNDKLEFLKESLNSIFNQTYSHIDIVIQVDGEVDVPVQDYLNEMAKRTSVEVFFNDSNQGLAGCLNNTIQHSLDKGKYSFLARMDADDISDKDRISKQVAYLHTHENISVVGSDVVEINRYGKEVFYKKMSSKHEDMLRNIIIKCPFNHPSVLFRMSVFSDGSRYKSHLKNTQDYYLWVDLISSGYKFGNINKPLLKFRVDEKFHSRRGFKKAFNDLNARLYAFKKLKNLSLANIIYICLLFLLRLSPSFLKKNAYRYLR